MYCVRIRTNFHCLFKDLLKLPNQCVLSTVLPKQVQLPNLYVLRKQIINELRFRYAVNFTTLLIQHTLRNCHFLRFDNCSTYTGQEIFLTNSIDFNIICNFSDNINNIHTKSEVFNLTCMYHASCFNV